METVQRLDHRLEHYICEESCGEEKGLLFVWDVLAVRAIGYKDREVFPLNTSRAIDVTSYDLFRTWFWRGFEGHRYVLFEDIRECNI